VHKLNSLIVLSAIAVSNFAFAADREDTLCGWFKERLIFQIWRSAAPDPDESRVAMNPLIKSVEFKTSDGKLLKGYKYRAQATNEVPANPKGYALMALGNAMIADRMIGYLEPFSKRGYDAYIFDYRGYGRSEGRRRINAFIEDYKELVDHLNARYERHLLYGVSLGVAVMANVVGSGVAYDRAVIDSSPSRFSPHGCPARIDPAENIPEDAKKMLVITGEKDTVLKPDMTSEYRELAEAKGAAVFHGLEYAHPFMDSREVHKDRLNRVIDFLAGQPVNPVQE
jgi:alpha/beta superfamily hydrolase